jgi:hypothetical protein
MNSYAIGETLYVVRSGMPDLINRQVTVVGDGRQAGMVDVQCVGDWTLPHGEQRAHVSESNLDRRPNPRKQ